MTLQLSGQSERVEPYRKLYGDLRVQMPLLVSGKDEKDNVVDIPRVPASFAHVLKRRMKAPKEVREAWQNHYLFTGDGSAAGAEGDHLIVLDARALRELTPKSGLYQGALVLPNGAWDELKSQKDGVFYLTAEEAHKVQGEGYIRKGGVWTPANKTVAKVWDHLSRGQDLTSYVKTVSKSSPPLDRLLNVYLNDTTENGKPTMRSWVASALGRGSPANGNISLSRNPLGCLIGVVPRAHVARQKMLEARV